MVGLHFGAVIVDQAKQYGPNAHLQITVTEEDRDAFRPLVEQHFEPEEKLHAGTDNDAWMFTLGVGSKFEFVRLIPGHLPHFDANTFSLFSPYADSIFALREQDGMFVSPIIAKVAAGCNEPGKNKIESGVEEILNSWLA